MKPFASELRGKTVMTKDGQILGILADLIIDTRTGRIESLLVEPAEERGDAALQDRPVGRLILGFRTMRAVRDVIVTEILERD